jgi:hypothetical protein
VGIGFWFERNFFFATPILYGSKKAGLRRLGGHVSAIEFGGWKVLIIRGTPNTTLNLNTPYDNVIVIYRLWSEVLWKT